MATMVVLDWGYQELFRLVDGLRTAIHRCGWGLGFVLNV